MYMTTGPISINFSSLKNKTRNFSEQNAHHVQTKTRRSIYQYLNISIPQYLRKNLLALVGFHKRLWLVYTTQTRYLHHCRHAMCQVIRLQRHIVHTTHVQHQNWRHIDSVTGSGVYKSDHTCDAGECSAYDRSGFKPLPCRSQNMELFWYI